MDAPEPTAWLDCPLPQCISTCRYGCEHRIEAGYRKLAAQLQAPEEVALAAARRAHRDQNRKIYDDDDDMEYRLRWMTT